MVGEPSSLKDDAPPSADEVGNHHWPIVSNIFAGHGATFPMHHSHPGLDIQMMRQVHKNQNTGGINITHDRYAQFHKAMEKPGCWSKFQM